VIRPGVYRHYKGGLYVVIGTARHHETGREFVVYHAMEPHGDESVISWNVRPVTGQYGDEDGWNTQIQLTTGGGVFKSVDRFTFLHPLVR
jgi:hypothetical protein